MNLRKQISILTLVLLLTVSFGFSGFALNAQEKYNNSRQGLIAVSYRGDTEKYPENSLEGVLSAQKIGADMVSVGVQKTKDGVFVLCEDENLQNICNTDKKSLSEITYEELEKCFLYDNSGKLTECKVVSLEKVLKGTDNSIILILDINPEDKDDVYDLVLSCDAIHRTVLRFEEKSKDIVHWINSKEIAPQVIGIYNGNIIWNAISHIENLSKTCNIVQYESKNYFNVMYGSFVYDRFSDDGKARALAPTYDYDICGQREDNASGWNELIEKGFSVIETNNIESLVKYTERAKELNESLEKLIKKAEQTDFGIYSDVSADNLEKALENAKTAFQKGIASVGELESANSNLLLSMNRLNLSDGHESQKGALNVTAGKIVAAILVGLLILAGQIYVHKMQKEKWRK